MNKDFWGPPTWCTIHSASAGYSPENRLSFKNFMYSLPHLLPCEFCREHLHENLESIPLNDSALVGSQQLYMWSYYLHDLVNRQLKKPRSPPFLKSAQYYHENVKSPDFWGPCFWRSIHAFAAAFRPTHQVKTAFKEFIFSLKGVLPGADSRANFNNFLNQLPPIDKHMGNAETLFLWTYLLHDAVNKHLGKVSPPFETIKAQYFNENVCSSCGVTG